MFSLFVLFSFECLWPEKLQSFKNIFSPYKLTNNTSLINLLQTPDHTQHGGLPAGLPAAFEMKTQNFPVRLEAINDCAKIKTFSSQAFEFMRKRNESRKKRLFLIFFKHKNQFSFQTQQHQQIQLSKIKFLWFFFISSSDSPYKQAKRLFSVKIEFFSGGRRKKKRKKSWHSSTAEASGLRNLLLLRRDRRGGLDEEKAAWKKNRHWTRKFNCFCNGGNERSSSVSVASARLLSEAKSYPADERNQWLQSGTPKGEKLNGNFPLFQVKHFSTSIHRLYGNFRRLKMMLLKISKSLAFSSKTETLMTQWDFRRNSSRRPLCSRSSRARHEKLLWCCLRDRIFQSRDGNIHRPSDDDDIERDPLPNGNEKSHSSERLLKSRAARATIKQEEMLGKWKKRSQNKLWFKKLYYLFEKEAGVERDGLNWWKIYHDKFFARECKNLQFFSRLNLRLRCFRRKMSKKSSSWLVTCRLRR